MHVQVAHIRELTRLRVSAQTAPRIPFYGIVVFVRVTTKYPRTTSLNALNTRGTELRAWPWPTPCG